MRPRVTSQFGGGAACRSIQGPLSQARESLRTSRRLLKHSWLRALLLLNRGRSRRTVRGRTQILCGGLGDLGGRELEVRADMSHLDLHAVTLRAVLFLPAALDELAGDEHSRALLKRAGGVLRDAAPGCAAEEPVVNVLPLAVVLAAVADRDGEACEGRGRATADPIH
jgi:hypothetical protein